MSKFLYQLRPSKDFGEKEYRKLRAKLIKKGEYKSLSHFYREKSKEYLRGSVVISKPRTGWKIELPKK